MADRANTSRKVVLTGGPCAGKTTIAEVLSKSFSDQIVVVPESASILIRGGFPRWQESSARRAFQTSVFQVQRQSEHAHAEHYPAALFLFDRGAIDGAAYWPEGPADFFKAMGTTEAAELARYDSVIYLESADEPAYELHRMANPARSEKWARARELDRLTYQIWARHPRIAVVKSQSSFADKVSAVVKLIESELQGIGRKP